MRLRSLYRRGLWWVADRRLRRQIARFERHLAGLPVTDTGAPVVFFNASTRIHRPSLNSGFSLLASWTLRQSGMRVIHAVCTRGMDLCILGTNREDYAAAPPCARCMDLSRTLFGGAEVAEISLDRGALQEAEGRIQKMSLGELEGWEWRGLPLGRLCLPGLRWALRRHSLPDDESTRRLFRRYLISAASLASRFRDLLEHARPRALVVFNGIMYPEAVARAVAAGLGVPVITHEVGLRPFSAFFSHREATFREIPLPDEFRLGSEENRELDRYLADRFRGKFSMAGIDFWPEMQGLPERLRGRLDRARGLVSVFTNVVFDTSQVHANVLYPDMFAWLEDVRKAIRDHPEMLFVIRAHPDEDRPGKQSRESVAAWVEQTGLEREPNLVFFGPSEYVSSYDLIRSSRCVLVYNSSIGLEAAILGAAVLCAGRARYTQVPCVIFPSTLQEYRSRLKDFLGEARIEVPGEFARNARRFLHAELHQASLDFSPFLQPYPEAPGMVLLTQFDPAAIADSLDLRVIRDGILDGRPFLLPAERPARAHTV